MTRPALRVVKLGGSLLDWAGLPAALRTWITSQPAAHNVLVVGGGRLADVIRAADQTHRLGQEPSHWLCVAAMAVTARLVARLLPEVDFAERLQLRDLRDGQHRTTVLDVTDFLRNVEPAAPGTRLPATWDVSSDSIAARLAVVLAADELVLLKSGPPPAGFPFDSAATNGYVDPFFSRLLADLPPTRAVDLRSVNPTTSARP